ncbi:MAG: transcription antitermination factor NusB [Phycisphaerales bacterium]
MATPKDIRRAALQALYQLDARGDADVDSIRASMDHEDSALRPAERDRAMERATRAFADRAIADSAVSKYAGDWPAHRQPAIDRAILRLAHFELKEAAVESRVTISAAVDLAKEFSTERSPAFINAVLDKIAKAMPRSESPAEPAPDAANAEA